MKKEDLFKIARLIKHSGIEWDVYDFDHTVDTGSFFGTCEDFELPAGRYVVTYDVLEYGGETAEPAYVIQCDFGGMAYFYLVG